MSLFSDFFTALGQFFSPNGMPVQPEIVPVVAASRPSPTQVALRELTATSRSFQQIKRRLTGTKYEGVMQEIADVCSDIYQHIEQNKTGNIPKTYFNDYYLTSFNTLFLLLTKDLVEEKEVKVKAEKKGKGVVPEPADKKLGGEGLSDLPDESAISYTTYLAQRVAANMSQATPRPRTIPSVHATPPLDLSFLSRENDLMGTDYLDWHIKQLLVRKLEANSTLLNRYEADYHILKKEVGERLSSARQTLDAVHANYAFHAAAHHGTTKAKLHFSGVSTKTDDDLKILLASDIPTANDSVLIWLTQELS